MGDGIPTDQETAPRASAAATCPFNLNGGLGKGGLLYLYPPLSGAKKTAAAQEITKPVEQKTTSTQTIPVVAFPDIKQKPWINLPADSKMTPRYRVNSAWVMASFENNDGKHQDLLGWGYVQEKNLPENMQGMKLPILRENANLKSNVPNLNNCYMPK